MEPLVKPLYTFDRFDELKQSVLDLIAQHNPANNQLMLQSPYPERDNWIDGTGSYSSIKYPAPAYCHLQPSLKGSVFDALLQSFPFPVFRGRIMIMNEHHCYSVHKDETPRVHVPIQTSKQAWFVFPEDGQVHHMPADGTVYWADTMAFHTFLNGKKTRVHLVFCVDRPTGTPPSTGPYTLY